MRELRPLEDAISRLERVFATQRSVRVVAPLAEAYRIERRLDEAVATARDGVRDYPRSISVRVVLARALRDQGHDEEAREAFREVMRLDPENMESLLFVESTPDPRWESPLEPSNREPSDATGPSDEPAGATGPAAGEARATNSVAESAHPEPRPVQLDSAPPEVEPSTEPVSLTSELAHLSDLFGPTAQNAPHAADGELTGIATLTLAEIYARQGLPDKAVEVCQQILATDPDDEEAKRRLEEYERALTESR